MSDVQERIREIVKSHKVVLFMKGTRMFPQCGFSARSVELLKSCGVKSFKDVNVLADAEIRQGIKDFSNWPTIPQCYIDGEFVGGSDILLEMYENGELHKLLGAAPPEPAKAPTVTVSPAAQQAIAAALQDASPGEALRFEVSESFQYELFFGAKEASDFELRCGDVTLIVPRGSAGRADGATIDFIDGPGGQGFKIDNPNEPPKVKALSAKDLKAWLDAGKSLTLFDVRGEAERAIAVIAAARPLDERALESLPKDALLVFHCHHGMRSRAAAQQCLERGYQNVYNLTGGIDAWSSEVDASVKRY